MSKSEKHFELVILHAYEHIYKLLNLAYKSLISQS